MKIRKIDPACNLDTVRDGRGGIFTFLPDTPIVEFNFQFVNKGKIRGNHYHPEFDEYYLFTDGNAVVVTKGDDGKEEFLYVGKGDCVYIPQGVRMSPTPSPIFNIVTFLTKNGTTASSPSCMRISAWEGATMAIPPTSPLA